MKDKIEVWLNVNCRKVIRDSLLNGGIAMGNEYRFDPLSWKVMVVRTADLFLAVLRKAVEARFAERFPRVELLWRTALGDDELLLVPPGTDREKRLPQYQAVMAFLRELLYEKRFVATVLRVVLNDVIRGRMEEKILAGSHDTDAIMARAVERLGAMDLAVEGVGAEHAAQAAAAPPPATPPDQPPADKAP